MARARGKTRAEAFRWSLLDYPFPPPSAVACTLIASFLLVGVGVFVFRRAERTAVDLL